MEVMARHRSHSVAFKRQVAEKFIAGETLHALSFTLSGFMRQAEVVAEFVIGSTEPVGGGEALEPTHT
jgi:hypothetical protein